MKIFLVTFLIGFYSINIAAEDKASELKKQITRELKTVNLETWSQQLDAYKGEIVVVDMWATWCSSCIERFPAMVEMQKEYNNQGVQFVSMLLEDPEEPEAIENAKRFLISQKADFDHFFMNENLMKSFEELDLLGIPAVYIYSRDGKLYSKLTGDNPNKQFTEKDIKDTIDYLLNKP